MAWFYPDCEQCGGEVIPESLDASEEWMGWCVIPAHCTVCGKAVDAATMT